MHMTIPGASRIPRGRDSGHCAELRINQSWYEIQSTLTCTVDTLMINQNVDADVRSMDRRFGRFPAAGKSRQLRAIPPALSALCISKRSTDPCLVL